MSGTPRGQVQLARTEAAAERAFLQAAAVENELAEMVPATVHEALLQLRLLRQLCEGSEHVDRREIRLGAALEMGLAATAGGDNLQVQPSMG